MRRKAAFVMALSTAFTLVFADGTAALAQDEVAAVENEMTELSVESEVPVAEIGTEVFTETAQESEPAVNAEIGTEVFTETAQETEPAVNPEIGTEVSAEIEPVTEMNSETPEQTELQMEMAADPEIAQLEEELIFEPEYADVEWTENELPEVPTAVAEDTDSAVVKLDADAFPDENFLSYVKWFDSDKDGYLSQSEIDKVDDIYVNDYGTDGIKSLKGIEYFSHLQYLSCSYNQLTELDVSRNTELKELSCVENKLTKLILGQNTALKSLECYKNQLTDLDISQNPGLERLDCGYNPITKLDVSRNTNLTYLFCSYSQLEELKLGQNAVLAQLYCSDNQLTKLDVSQSTNLSELICYSNQLTQLDVTQNRTLTRLACGLNQLTELDISQNTELTELDCGGNQLTQLDVSRHTELTELDCSDNPLRQLDVSQNTGLTKLSCYLNQLTELDVSQNTELTELSCGRNQLTELDVSHNTELTELSCYYDQLTELDLSRNTGLTYLNCTENALAVLDLSMCGDLEECYISPQHITDIDWKETGTDLILDMAKLVGIENLSRVSGLYASEKDTLKPLDMNADGTVVLPKDALPEKISYSYDTGSALEKLSVVLDLKKESESEPEHTHSYKTVTSKEPTCTETGLTYEECGTCHQKKEGSEKTLPALGHTGGTATCAAKAVCTRCKQPYGELATAHSYGAYAVTKEPTALEEGIQTRTCVVCGEKETKPVAKLKATMKLNATSIKLKAKQSTTKVKVSGLAAGDAVASWSSSNPKIVSVNSKGKITAKSKKGNATITVTLKSGLSQKIKVTVQKDTVACTKVTLNKKTVTLKKGKTFTLKATVKPLTCVQKAKYKTSNKSVATVSVSGKIKAKKKGTATITVTVGKKKATCKVKVK